MKFPRAAEMMAELHANGFKCSTNVTPLVTDNPLDERGEMTPFRQRRELWMWRPALRCPGRGRTAEQAVRRHDLLRRQPRGNPIAIRRSRPIVKA